MITTIITFIIVFGILVIVHEFGHFHFAKRGGILVREFPLAWVPSCFIGVGKTARRIPFGYYQSVATCGWPVPKMMKMN